MNLKRLLPGGEAEEDEDEPSEDFFFVPLPGRPIICLNAWRLGRTMTDECFEDVLFLFERADELSALSPFLSNTFIRPIFSTFFILLFPVFEVCSDGDGDDFILLPPNSLAPVADFIFFELPILALLFAILKSKLLRSRCCCGRPISSPPYSPSAYP